ncbi:MAG: hypothetical protein EXR66_08200 [Dehalococcoidia bacterium]|nr:hypothetical protein [Dehalococcoidia bacterium]
MTRELRCAMRECRRRIDLDALPAVAYPERDACMHFIAAWGGARGAVMQETFAGLDGNREFVIRNIRPAELPAAGLELARLDIEGAIARYAHIVNIEPGAPSGLDGGALFGDEFERNGLARALARLILGVDPILGTQNSQEQIADARAWMEAGVAQCRS